MSDVAEMRTIDLAALATELEAAGWEVECSSEHCTFRHGYRVIRLSATGEAGMWNDFGLAQTSPTIPYADSNWQTALGIIQRHIDGSRS